jgi:hypothetical protein
MLTRIPLTLAMLILLMGSQSGLIRAEELDSASTEALLKTQQLLQSPALRDKAIGESANAGMIDSQVKSLAGNAANTEAIYSLSSDVMAEIVKETHGDPAEMQKLLAKAKDNPKEFFEHLSEKSRAAIQAVSKKVSDSPAMQRTPASR